MALLDHLPLPLEESLTLSGEPLLTAMDLVHSMLAGLVALTILIVEVLRITCACLVTLAQYTLSHRPGVYGHSRVYLVEYEEPVVAGRNQHDAPCAVCHVSDKMTVAMIPAYSDSPTGRTREYYDYLMSDCIMNHRTEYVCVDKDMESTPGSY